MRYAAPLTVIAALGFAHFGCAERDASNVVEVTARGLEFEAPDSVASGWVTFHLRNESDLIHFALVSRLPEGFGIEEHQEVLARIFQEGMDLLNAGEADAAMEKFGTLPEWFSDVVFLGGPGFISAGRTAQATVYLEPGTYVIECYVKTNGMFHSYNPSPDSYGMAHELTVTEDSAAAPEPDGTIRITLSSEDGIEVEGDVSPGEHTVAVHFSDQQVHENFVGHDVHLVRLREDTDLDRLGTWMDWMQPTGLETPAPAEFLGGTHEIPAGKTAYFTVRLEPGRYAWIAEVTNPADKGMLTTFSVPAVAGGGY